LSIRKVELIWLWRVLLPSLLLFYCVCGISVALHAVGLAAAPHGTARVVQLALEGHLAAGLLVGLLVAIGSNALRALGGSAKGVEGWVFALVAGFWLFDLTAFLLAVAGLLRAEWVLLSIGTLWFASWWLATRIAGAAPALFAVPDLERRPFAVAAGAFALLAILVWLWPLLVQTALPNSDWDSALYHLPLAERYLAGLVWNTDPLFSADSFPGTISLIYAVFLAFDLEHAVIPFDFLFILATLVAVYALARRLAGSWAGIWSLLVGAGIHALWQQGVDPRVDGFLSFFVVAAALAMVCSIASSEDRVAPGVLGAALGLAIGTKYTAVFIVGAFGAVWIAAIFFVHQGGGKTPRSAAMATALALLLFPHAAWYASNVALHGDPLFPMLRGDYYLDADRPGERIAMSGALDPWLEEPSAEVERREARLEDVGSIAVESHLFDLPALVSHPERYATKPNHFVSPLLLLALALPFALPRERNGRIGALAVAALGLGCFVGIASQTNLVRYALPFLALWAALCGVVLARVTQPIWRVVWFVIGATLLLGNHQAEADKLARLQPAYYAQVDGDRLRWLSRVGYNFTPAMPRVVSEINRRIAAGEIATESRILLAGEGKGRLLECESLPDLSWFLQRFAVELLRADSDPQRVLASLRSQGVTHILYNPGYFRWVAAHTSFSKRQIAFTMVQLEDFLERHGSLVFESAGMEFVRLAPATETP